MNSVKRIGLIAVLVLGTVLAIAQRKPITFPEKTAGDNDFIPTQTGVGDYKITFPEARKYFLPNINPIAVSTAPDSTGNTNNRGQFVKNSANLYYIDGNGRATKFNSSVDLSAVSYTATTAFTGSVLTGQNPNTTTLKGLLDYVFYPTQPPTSALTTTILSSTGANQQFELMTAGAALSVTLNYSAGRNGATEMLASTVVGGVTITPNPSPAAGGFVSGTRAVTLARNTNDTYNNVVTTTDGKTSTSTSTITWLGKRYYGFLTLATANTPTDGELTGAVSQSLISTLGTVNYISGASAGTYMVIAYPASFTNLSSITINGFPSIDAFTLVTRSVTNASGYSQSYKIYTSNNVFSTASVQTVIFN